MKYLKLVNSFDEFAEDAKAGTVYYDIGDSVYYWLNLRSIWGYIGYNSYNNAFYTNGTNWSIVPPVPDPETLESPVRIDKNSFVDIPDTITFKYSPFNIVPIKTFYGVPNKTVRYVVECNNDYSPTEIIGAGNAVEVEIEKALLNNLQTVSSSSKVYLILNNTNGFINLSTINMGTTSIGLKAERGETSISENSFFINIADGLQRQIDWYDKFKVSLSEEVSEHVVKLHQLPNGNRPLYKVDKIYGDTINLVIDGTDSQGVMDDDCWGDVRPAKKYFNSISYVNISDFGSYYKIYLASGVPQPLTTEALNFCKTNDCLLYPYNKSMTITAQDWKTFTDSEYDLTGVKYLKYYIKTDITVNEIPNCYTVGSESLTESEIEENRVCKGDKSVVIYATPKFNNINLNDFAFLDSSSSRYIYIRTTDSDIYLKKLPSHTHLHLNNKHIHISGSERIEELYIGMVGTDFTGNIIFENRQQSGTPIRTGLYFNQFMHDGEQTWSLTNRNSSNPIFVLSGAVTTQNPTPEDYYYTGLTTGNMINLFNRKVFDIDLVNGITIGYSYITGKFYTPADWSSIKCFRPSTVYVDTMYVGNKSSSVEAGSAQINALIAAVPNISVTSGNFYFSSTQYALLSSTQINYLTGLGYLVIERI